MIEAVIFDFNSTLYYDKDINEAGWAALYEEFFKTKQGAEEFGQKATLCNNRTNVQNMYQSINKIATEAEIDRYSRRKEEYYHEIATKQNRKDLAPGVEQLLDYLKENKYKLNICTASIKYNVDFYFKLTPLSKWFDKELVSYDDNKVSDKVEMYKIAAKNINVEPRNCLVFEDSAKSIEEAIKAGFDKFIYVNHYNKQAIDRKEIIQEIKEYNELDYSIFK